MIGNVVVCMFVVGIEQSSPTKSSVHMQYVNNLSIKIQVAPFLQFCFASSGHSSSEGSVDVVDPTVDEATTGIVQKSPI